MLHVVGGTYLEWCREPTYDDLFGSGTRAAAAAARLSDDVHLSTYIGQDEEATLRAIAASFGFSVAPVITATTIRFTYLHSLSPPSIVPNLGKIERADSLNVTGDNILRFGMLEGDAVVQGSRVVYDPQSAFRPQSFIANGSSAEHLAIVANYREASALTNESDAEQIGRVLLDEQGAEVIVIKRGVAGASVITKDGLTSIPAYRTQRVWKIGSGDVFAAIFAHYWAEQGQNPIDAAQNASLSTAYYCNTRVLPVPVALAESFQPSVVSTREDIGEARPLIYLAGPFFTIAQRWLINEARDTLMDLSDQISVFSPLHDVGHGSAAVVVPADIEALNNSSAVLAIVDGLDAGTIFEVGYARAKETPVIAFVQNESSDDMTMLEGTDCMVTNDFVSAVYNTVWEAIAP